MSNGLKVQYRFRVPNGRGRRKEDEEAGPVGRVPRLSRLLALAIRCERLLRDGVVKNQAELARLGHVTPARMTQIMNLLNLAPDIQEEILFLPLVHKGRGMAWEGGIREVTCQLDWREQRRMWTRFGGGRDAGIGERSPCFTKPETFEHQGAAE